MEPSQKTPEQKPDRPDTNKQQPQTSPPKEREPASRPDIGKEQQPQKGGESGLQGDVYGR